MVWLSMNLVFSQEHAESLSQRQPLVMSIHTFLVFVHCVISVTFPHYYYDDGLTLTLIGGIS